MKTREEVMAAIRAGKESQCIDGRDFSRLADFFPVEAWEVFGYGLKEGYTPPVPEAWTRENILSRLQGDVAFGFEKALGKRGISSDLMFEVVKMWLWVLEDPLQYWDVYPMYGLPLFKAVALRYGWPNPIGEDTGCEDKYGEIDE